MIIVVYNLHSEEEKRYQGEAQVIAKDLLEEYPFLQMGDLDDLLEQLNDTQAYEAGPPNQVSPIVQPKPMVPVGKSEARKAAEEKFLDMAHKAGPPPTSALVTAQPPAVPTLSKAERLLKISEAAVNFRRAGLKVDVKDALAEEGVEVTGEIEDD